jgi:hypothetical protein
MSVIPEDFTEIDKLIGYKPTPKSVSRVDVSDDEDYAIRTIIGEAQSQDDVGKQAVAGVIRNRANGAKQSFKDIVLAKSQFEPWSHTKTRNYITGIKQDSPLYQQIARTVLPVLRGEAPDPTKGATHFYAPKAQRALGRPTPDFDNGKGFDIGDHRFFNLGYSGKGRHGTKSQVAPPIADNTNFDDIDKLIGYGKFAKTPVDDFTEIDALIGYQPTQSAPEDTGTIYGQPADAYDPTNPPPPALETDDTILAQLKVASDPSKPRKGVFFPENDTERALQIAQALDQKEWGLFPDKQNKGYQLVHLPSAKKLKLRSATDIQTYIDKNPNALVTLTSKAYNAGQDTGGNKQTVSTIDPQTGVELTSSVVTPATRDAQVALDKANHPNGVSVDTTTDAVVAGRLNEGTPPRSDKPRTQADINAEFEQWVVANRLPRNNDSVAKFNAMKKAEVDDENEIIKAMNVASDLTDLNIIGEAAKEGKSAKDALARQAEIQKRFETEKAANPALTVEQFNATLAAENEAASAKSKAEWLAKNPKYAQFATAKQLDPHDPKTIEAYNAQLGQQVPMVKQPIGKRPKVGQRPSQQSGTVNFDVDPNDPGVQAALAAQAADPNAKLINQPVGGVQMQEIDSRDANAVSKAYADIINIPASVKDQKGASDYALKYLQAKYPNGKFSGAFFPKDWNAGDPIGISYDTLAGAGVDIAPDVAQKVAENRVENPKPNLQVGKDWVKEDAEWLNSNAGKTLKYVNPLFDFLDDDTKNSIASSAIGGAIGSGARVGDAVAGIARWNPLFEMAKPLTGDLSAKMREMSKPGAELELKTGDDSTTSKMFKIAGAAPGDLSRLILLTRFGGAITGGSGVIVGMAADQGLQSAGRQESPWEVAKQTGKGAIIGTIFAAAPTIGKIGGSAVAGGKLAKGFSKEAFTASTIMGGTYATEKAFGSSDDQATQAAIINTLFHLTNTGVKLAGKAIKARDSQGRETNVYVDPDGNIKLLKGEVKKPDVEMYVETAKGSDGVYRTKGDTTPDRVAEEPYSVGNRGNKIGTSREPAQLEQQNPYRIPQAKPEAVAKAAEDPRVQKLATILKSGEPMSIEDLKKSSRYSPENVTDAVDTLVQARLVEILPDNTVRLIGEAPGKANVNLFEKYTNPVATQEAPQSETQTSKRPISDTQKASTPSTQTENVSPKDETIDTSVYETLPEQKPKVAEVAKPKAEVITEERPDHVKTLNVFTERGTKAAVEPKVIDASDLLTSMDEGYPTEYQPRDRSRIASKAQISKIASDLNPEFLGDSPKAGDGRPLVVPVMIDGKKKYAVISGNGRTEAIREAYAAQNEGAGKYRDYVTSKGETEHKTPVYVGILDPNETDLNKFAHEANESAQARMSPTEQAKADAERMDAGTMQSFVPADDGSIHREANRDFIRGFFDNTVGEAERAAYILPDGSLNQDGINRVRNAIFAKAFGDTKEGVAAIQRMAESTSDSVKNVTNALLGRAPHIAAYKESAAQGMRHKEFDIGNDLAAAVAQYANIKSPDAKIKSVDEYIAQGNMFGAETTPFQTRVMQVFDQHKRSPKAIKSILDNFLSAAHAIGDPNQQSIFGKTDLPSVESIFEGAVQAYERNISTEPTQASIFEENQRVQPETVGSPQGYQVAPATSIETQQERTPASSVGGSGSNNPPPPPTDGDEPPRKRANRGITSIPDATETPKAERDLKPIPLSVKRSMVRREMAKKDADPQLIADAYGLTKQQVEDVRELGPVGKYGQMSHILRAAMADNLELLNKFAKVILPEARVNENNPLFGTQDAASAILDKAAELMGYGRSSEMGKVGLNKFLDTFADKLPMEAVVLVHDAIAHFEEWYRKRAKFAEEVANSAVMDDIIRQSSQMGKPVILSFKDTPPLNTMKKDLRAASLRGRILAIGKKYEIEKGADGTRYTGLSRPVIEQAFNEALEKAFRERTDFRISTPGTRATSGNINQEGKGTEGEREVDQGDIQFALAPEGDAFDKWFGDSKVVDENGEPLVVYHGTTHDFDTFDADRTNIENHFGKGIYLTDSPYDVEVNYAGEGPDLTQRIEREAERVAQELEERRDEKGKPSYQGRRFEELAKIVARRRLKGSDGATMPLYAKIENPVYIGIDGERTYIDSGYESFDEAEPEQYDDDDNETQEWVDWDERRTEHEESQYDNESPLIQAIQRASYNYEEIDTDQILEDIQEFTMDGGTADELDAKLRASEGVMYATDDEGNLASHDFIKEVFRRLGYDGIIMNADQAFGSGRTSGKQMSMDYGTKHYIAFEPNQVKSAIGNNGNFDPNNDSILFTNAFDQTDLFGNPVSPMTSQGSLFDMGAPVKKAEVDLAQFVDKQTADFLKSLEKSSDKTVAKAASTIIGSARYARSKDAKTVIEDAADALDAFSRAKHAHTTVANILKQQTFDKQTVGEMLSPRSAKLAEAMEAGHLGRTLNSELGDSNVQFMVAWHGSPHTFDKFDISKIGTGEGAQAYGHGLYFTDKEAVAQHYKDALERRVPVTLKINGTELTEANSLSDYRDAFGESAEGYDTQYFRAMIEAIENDKLDDVKIIDRKLHAHVQDLLRNNNVEVIKPRGAKYRVDLKPEQDEYLLWDKPFSQQSEKVQKALMNKVVYSSDIRTYKESQEELDYLDKHGKLDTPEWDKHVERLRELRKEYPLTEIFAEDKEGDEIYEAIANDEDSDKREAWVEQRDWLIRNKGASHPETLAHLADNPRADKLASEKLKSLGIRGIKYLDGSSRGKGEGSYNYVIFDDADVEITDIQFDANAKSVKRENSKAKQMIKAARALSPLAVSHRAKVSVDPQTRLLQAENMEALAVIHEAVRAIDPEKYGRMSFSGASFTPRAAQELLDVFNSAVDHATAAGNTRIATALSKIGNAVEAAIDPKHGDLVVSINIPSLPQLSRHTAQEELSHRNNRRSGARDIFADIASTDSIQKSLANLGPGYARIGVTGAVDEVIAKSFRDDAETELGISADDVWNNLTEFWRGATDAGIEVAQYGNISKTGKRFDKFVEGERAKRDVQTESERTAIRNTRSGDLPNARREGNQRSPQTRTVSKDDRLAKLRQTELSTASGGSGLALLDPPALTPLQERYIALRAKGDIELQKDLATDVRFSHWGSVNINGKSLALKVKGVAIDIANAPRAIKASSDLSAAGRQGLISSVNHPVLATRAFMKQLSMLPPKSGARRYEKFKRDLDLHPFIELAETSGLHLTSMGDGAMSHREEAFMSQILGDDPYFTRKTPEAIRKLLTFPVRVSERAYVTFLDYMRINTFASLAKELHRYNVRKGKPDEDAQYEALARWVNNATGRGDLGMLDNAAPILNATFFSARYWKSRLQVLNPRYYQKLPPGARKLAIREMLTFVAAFASVMAILKALGFKIETGDEDNPDLLKLRLGNYSYEFSAGLIGHLRYITRMVMSVADPGKRGTLDSMQYLTGRYLRAKLAPIPGAVVNTVDKKNYIGEPTSAKEEAMGIFTPIMADNFKDAVKADGIDGAVKMLPEFFGISTTRYSKPDEYQTKIQEERAKPANTPAEREERQRRIKLWQSLKDRAAKYQ